MFTDLVDSVALKGRLGASSYGELIARHDALFMNILHRVPGAELRQDTGDGFYVLFPTSTSAVETALKFQLAIHSEHWPVNTVSVRIGLHMGEISVLRGAGEQDDKLVGLPIDLTARIMGLAQGGQTLMSRAVFDDARQYLRKHPVVSGEPSVGLEWMAHGSYQLKGQKDPVHIFEVGGRGIAPLRPPSDSKKAKRVVSTEEASLMGWRPAANLEVPHRPDWVLVQKLGEGGVGEVWIAEHRKLDEERIFKFCFSAEKLRILKRELNFFRLFRKKLGYRRDIGKLHDVHVERPPYFLESEFTKQGDLVNWTETQGGVNKVPLATRLDLIAQCADALSAAHSVGVLHKDIKPINILIELDAVGAPYIKLSGFGIAELTEKTETLDISPANDGSALSDSEAFLYTSSRFHIPPETLAGHSFTVRSDIYALGVMLYQIVVGDLKRPLAPGWEREVSDPLLCADIARCVDGDPARRFSSAHEVAERIRSLGQRRNVLESKRKNSELQARWKQNKRFTAIAVVTLIMLVGGVTTAFVREQGLREKAEQAHEASKLEAAKSSAISHFLQEMLSSFDPENAQGREFTVTEILEEATKKLEDEHSGFQTQPMVEAGVRLTLADTLEALGKYEQVLPHLTKVLSVHKSELGNEHADTLNIIIRIARLHWRQGHYDEAESLFHKGLEIQRRIMGDEHPDALTSMDGLAVLYLSQGRYDEADSIHLDVLSKRQTILGEDHPDTLESVNNLAMLRRAQGQFDDAEQLYIKVLETRRRILGNTHPDTLRYIENLAGLYHEQGRYDDAEPLLVHALEKQRQILGEDHPDTLYTMNSLAALYYQEGRYSQAEPLLLKGVESRRQVLGNDHQHTLAAINNLAALYWKQGRFDEAEPLFVLILGSQQNVLGTEHPDTLITMNNLGVLYSKLGRYDVAELFLGQAIDGRQRVLGNEHPSTLNSMTNLAALYSITDRVQESQQLALKTFAKQRDILGAQHPHTQKTLRLLTELQETSGAPIQGVNIQALPNVVKKDDNE